MKKFCFALLLLLPMYATAQDRLEPIQFFRGISAAYKQYVMDTIIGEGTYHFAYISRPSFRPEYGLVYNRHKGTLTYSLVECEHTNIWYCLLSGKKKYQLNRWSVYIPEEVGDSLYKLVRVAIATAVVPIEDDMMWGEDGTIYQFLADFYSAQCWSPHSGNNVRLVRLMNTICELVKENNPNQIISLLPEISSLTADYREKVCVCN